MIASICARCFLLLVLGVHARATHDRPIKDEGTIVANLPSTKPKVDGNEISSYPLLVSDGMLINDIAPKGALNHIINNDDGRHLLEVNDTSKEHQQAKSFKSSSTAIIQPAPIDRLKRVWDAINSMDSYKTSTSYQNGVTRPTLTSIHYFILPIWWSNESPSDPSLTMDTSQISSVMDENYWYYHDMSWGKCQVTYTILAQTQIDVSNETPGFDDTQRATRDHIDSLGYEQFVDYDGIIMLHNVPQNPPLGLGGWGDVNGLFMWMSHTPEYPMDYYVTRHEAGHNFGHDHHLSNSYEYRFNRPVLKEGEGGMPYDGYDMMSGGNNLYHGRHFSPASKWFFNWIPNESIILMQPEGSTNECIMCLNTGTFTISKFDDHTFEGNIMAIHIPITVAGNKVFSFWFSYRSDPDTRDGLSIHLSWFILGGHFGTYYDSLNFDAYGDTLTREDSFVVVNTCYVVNPSSYMKDIDFDAAIAIQPVVCVDSIDEGKDITVSVEFLDPKESNDLSSTETLEMQCSQVGDEISMSLDITDPTLLHIKNTGQDGTVSLSFCPSGPGDLTTYVYDDFPSAPINYDSEPAYGSYKSLTTNIFECCQPGSTISVTGATVVKVTNMAPRNEFLHLNEIEIYNAEGENVALNGKCYSRSSDWDGDASCLNDGVKGKLQDTCNSHSSFERNSFDFCVLNGFVDVKKIKVFPMYDPERLWMLDRMSDIKVDVFVFASGLNDITDPNNVGNDIVEFTGLMESFSLVDVFNRDNYSPETLMVALEETSIPCSATVSPEPLTYETDFGEAWVYIPPLSSGLELSLSVSCSVNDCRAGEYMDLDGHCYECPGQMVSDIGSTSVDECKSCPDGSVKSLTSLHCVISEEYKYISSSKRWRIWAPEFHTLNGWSWDVERLEFYEDEECQGSIINHNEGQMIDSGNAGAGWGPSNAFDADGGVWGGRFDDYGTIWLGLELPSLTVVSCVKITNSFGDGRKGVTEIRVQAYIENKSKWKNVMIKKNIDTSAGAVSVIHLVPAPPCKDASKRSFQFSYKGRNMHCKKLKKKKQFAIKKICSTVEDVKENCRVTCQSC